MKRHLSPEEIKICRDSLKRLKNEIIECGFALEENLLVLYEGIDLAFKKQIKEYENMLKDTKPNGYDYKMAKLKIKVIKYNYPKQKEKYKELIKDLKDRIDLNKHQIRILTYQIRNGVTVIEKTAPQGV